ncbi:MAG: hypothetical protein NUV86_08140, partial [Candidatus Scalindua sp.]|nr:hypothetical protein [Candidatus Scalindua sp.]
AICCLEKKKRGISIIINGNISQWAFMLFLTSLYQLHKHTISNNHNIIQIILMTSNLYFNDIAHPTFY